jgi:hypothetical protein
MGGRGRLGLIRPPLLEQEEGEQREGDNMV